jgi:N-acetyl sugar amidotransferase
MEKYNICNRCVMDTTAHDITFDENGYCNYCNDFIEAFNNYSANNTLLLKKDELISQIKKDGNNKPYDCIVGVSGGVDSSYVLHLVKQNGLRPLAVHLDNGWNCEFANQNISNLVNKLGVDLYTHTPNFEENCDLQRSFFSANVLDIELITDNAIIALNFQLAKKYKLKYILSGSNISTEGMKMPSSWGYYNKRDKKNIISIHKKFGKLKIKTIPFISTFEYIINDNLFKRRWINFLDYFEYKKTTALNILMDNYDYKPYPYKHYESIFTRFYQGYILPKKFNVDKRRIHFSTLIITGQMTRNEALLKLKDSPYPNINEMLNDKETVLKRLRFTENSFNEYLNSPEISHDHYKNEIWITDLYNKMPKIKKIILWPKRMIKYLFFRNK